MKRIILAGATLVALANNTYAQFAIENNAKMGAKVESVSEANKRFLLDFSSDAEVGKSVQIKGLYARSFTDAGESVSVDMNRGKCESLNGNGNPLVLGETASILSTYGTEKPVVGFIGLGETNKAFGMFAGSNYKNVEIAMVFSLRGCNMESDVMFDLVTIDGGTTGGKNTYKLLVGLDTHNNLGANEYENLENASASDNTDKWFVFDNIYQSGATGDKKTVNLNKLIGKPITDLSYKTIYVFLYTSGSDVPAESGKYDPVVCFDNLSFGYGQPTWIVPEALAVDQNFNYNDSVPIEVQINTSKEFKFQVKDKNRGGTLIFRCNAEKLPLQSIRWNFPQTGAIKAKDANGAYTIDVPYSFTPCETSGSQVIMTVPAPAAGQLVEDDLEVTLLFTAPKRVIARPLTDKIEIDNGIRHFMTVLAKAVETVSGISTTLESQNGRVYVVDGKLKVIDVQGTVDIYSLSGMKIRSVYSEKAAEGVALDKGTYVVMADGVAHKVIVR